MVGRQVRWKVELAHLDVAEDRGQEIVEVVGYAARKPPDPFHLLRLQQLLDEGSPLGYVLDNSVVGDWRAVGAQPEDRRAADPADLSVLAADAVLERPRALSRDGSMKLVNCRFAILIHHNVE